MPVSRTYKPVEYWTNRKIAAPRELPGYAAEYIQSHTFGSVLEYGVGEGRLIGLLGDVTGFDIVQRDLPIPMDYNLEGTYDCVVASKVLLHVLPENIEQVMEVLSGISGKVVVYDTVGKCRAAHNFNHNFQDIVTMNDVVIKGKDLLFWYA